MPDSKEARQIVDEVIDKAIALRKSNMPKTIKDILEKWFPFSSQLDHRTALATKDLLTLISECVGEMEETNDKSCVRNKPTVPNLGAVIRNRLRKQINSAISGRSGICDKEK